LLEAEKKRTAKPTAPVVAKPYTVLIPVAAPRSGAPLLQLADLISGPGSLDRRIYALHLRRPTDRSEFRSGWREAQRPMEDQTLRMLLDRAEGNNIPVELISFLSRNIPRDIARTAREREADLVLIGYHNPVFGRSMLGGTVHRVLSQTPTDVAVFIDRGFSGVQRVLVPFLGGRHDRLAMTLAGKLAANAKAQVTVLHVTAPQPDQTPLNAKQAVDQVFNDPSQPLPVHLRVIVSGDPVGTVIKESEGFDLVVIGVAEEWGLESQLFSLRRERIAAGTPTSLLIVRQRAKPKTPAEDERPSQDRVEEVPAQAAGTT
jgi:nucleotide-binding universal stress UspA family protein